MPCKRCLDFFGVHVSTPGSKSLPSRPVTSATAVGATTSLSTSKLWQTCCYPCCQIFTLEDIAKNHPPPWHSQTSPWRTAIADTGICAALTWKKNLCISRHNVRYDAAILLCKRCLDFFGVHVSTPGSKSLPSRPVRSATAVGATTSLLTGKLWQTCCYPCCQIFTLEDIAKNHPPPWHSQTSPWRTAIADTGICAALTWKKNLCISRHNVQYDAAILPCKRCLDFFGVHVSTPGSKSLPSRPVTSATAVGATTSLSTSKLWQTCCYPCCQKFTLEDIAKNHPPPWHSQTSPWRTAIADTGICAALTWKKNLCISRHNVQYDAAILLCNVV